MRLPNNPVSIITGICVLLLAVGANAYGTYFSSSLIPEYDAAEKSMRQQRIKRLKPADPESTEVMLADRGLDISCHA